MRSIDCDTHYWPIPFLDHVNHAAKGRVETVDADTVAFYRDGELIAAGESGMTYDDSGLMPAKQTRPTTLLAFHGVFFDRFYLVVLLVMVILPLALALTLFST